MTRSRDYTHRTITQTDLPPRLDSLYFIGAGGIGMAALERYWLSRGMAVGGYDRTPTALTRQLAEEGVEIAYEADPGAVPGRFSDPDRTLVVITPAIGPDNPLPGWFGERGHVMVKRAQLLGLVTEGSRSLCFAGTHGKTTTSSMAAHLLHCGPAGCNAFLGGILRNYGSNLLLSQTSPYSVIEADEYDRSFHHLRPTIAVITSTDPDHLDIYGTEEAYLESFRHFTRLISPGGTLIMHTGLRLKPDAPDGVRVMTYGRDSGDWHAANIRRSEGRLFFDMVTPDRTIADIELGVPADINVDNAVAALAAVDAAGELDADTARRAMASFQGPKRRFELRRREAGPGGRVIIDDYAHHPDELRASIRSVRGLYPGRRLTVAFQPHLYSRTRDFAGEFADALSLADEVILLDIYPAREEPIAGVSSEMIFRLVRSSEKMLICKNDFIDTMKIRNFDVLLTAGAGDISDYIDQIADAVGLG